MNYDEILKTSTNLFSNYYIIDVNNDKVLEYDNEYKLLNELSFYNFLENMKRIIHKDDINKYFDSISLKKLNEEKENGNNVVSCNYQKIYNNNYKKYSSFAKIIEKDNNKLIIIFETEVILEQDNNISIDSDEVNNKIKYLSEKVSDIIYKILNTIAVIDDNSEMFQIKNALDYITSILNNLVKDIPELNQGLESQMILEINKNKPTLLIIDDDLMTRNLIKKAFSDEYEILMASNGQIAIDMLEENNKKNSIEVRDNIVGIFLDLAMPVLDGFEVLEYLKLNNIINKVPIIIISAAEEKSTRQRVYQYKIADMLEKPFNLELIKYRTNNLINLYKTSNSLDELISKKDNKSSILLKSVLDSYLSDNELKIEYIRKISKYFLNKLIVDYPDFRLSSKNIENILEASKYYDIGTYFVSKNKTTSEEDYLKHTDIGYDFAESYLKSNLDKDVYNYVLDIVKYHHDKYDGSGIHHITGDSLPIYVQIIALSIQCSDMLINKNSLNELYTSVISEKGKKYNDIIVNLFEKYYKFIFN